MIKRTRSTGAAILIAAMVLLFVGGAIVDGHAFAIDGTIMRAVRRAFGTGVIAQVMTQLTALGSVPVLALIVLAATGLLAVARRGATALALIIGTAGGGLAITLLKAEVARPRPEIVSHLVLADGMSFPSGHAAGSALVYLTLAGLLAPLAETRAVRRYLVIAAAGLVVLIGASRMYLGVHWPSDVLAGWCFGSLWAWGWSRLTAATPR